MVTFLSVFLSLVAGPQSVELAVGDGVAAVELRLDGRPAGRLGGAPWTIAVDLGPDLAPHRLSAVAFDAAGRETGRAEQWINLPRPRSQVELLPRSAAGEPPRSVRLSWRSVDGARPDAATITFDGTPLEIVELERVELPAYDPDRIHLLKAELRFGLSLAHAELLIGGAAGEAIGSDLTAFPVALTGRRKPPAAEEMNGWFRSGGSPLRVAAVDRGPADLILVQDQSPRVLGQLERLRRDALDRSPGSRQRAPGPVGIRQADRLRVIVPFALPVARAVARPVARERRGAAGEGTASRPADNALPRELFPISGDLAVASRAPTSVGVGRRLVAGPRPSGLLAALFYRAPPAGVGQRLADAVAEAGRAAAAGGRARVVVLVTGPESADASRFTPRQARDYLRRLQVPLVVWAPEAPPGWASWGPAVTRISGPSRLDRALRHARTILDRQLVVWLEGRHLPHEIELTAAAAGSLRPVAD